MVIHVIVAPKPTGLYALRPILSNNAILGRERVTSMERRVSGDATVAGVNGDLFSFADGHPSGGLIRGGILDRGPSDSRSTVGIAVRAGAPKPDIRTVEALKRTLLTAKSIAYSDSASGVYLATVLFPKLGIWDQIKSKSRKIEADPVGGVVATGEVEIGFQQISELRPVKGIDIVGELPPGAQIVTVFAAGIPTTSKQPEAAKSLIEWLASPKAYAAIKKSSLEPANASAVHGK